MEADAIYQKTDTGLDEIKTRKLKLPPKLRTMLILIDGTAPVSGLETAALRIGVQDDYIAQLERLGLIARLGSTEGSAAALSADTERSVTPDETVRFRQAQKFMYDTVVNAIGVRSFFFTLKLDKCSTRAELAELVDGFGKAVAKGEGEDAATVLVQRIRELLG